ncbi:MULTISPECIES: sigma-70 family RNA polymerase sigma factor [unclassified Breznakia]|uniref:RNA polymerase sigma factor n=1 Tax=unclassified Breznakia TaxID=2623764 RepID=UPI002476D19B|nr:MULTISPECIES: sigma-70 family RNA polymerase sigma factor [unclassified Breznakia]MDH6367801.1 RNA polymerase sigma factor (sigma-70 family) [Breznakia sp. PH1-1]MDH6404902.1 RNA polymerase sigma factor (sigma-70 family) [Breznakia sp. PF1-11]MDH6412604.1 RNA polymerase sigma factor (sigma-70 family) [Breznakia sp. PFB1-11]MDH6414977.1 RNA polymerase sigma factor (sigma-70 family) [Breznakia sp. PFB1-14]MDH6417288.1 RNA polymerase sigma factor (sigma-70 family) [Breznakia sp. PFB1-4]
MEEVYNLVSIDIIEKAVSGDTDAFSEIYRAYYNKVYFIATHFFRDEQVASDVLQEVFIKVYKKLRNLNDPKYFHAWIQRIVYNECLNYARKEKKYTTLEDGYAVDNFEDVKQDDISTIIENKQVMNAIMDSLNSMSIPLKSVGILRYYEELPLEEISKILNIPRGTVSSRLNKIKKTLRVDLQKQGISPKSYSVLLLSPGVLEQAYRLLSELCSEGASVNSDILQKILGGGTLFGMAFKTKVVVATAAAVCFTGAAYIHSRPSEPVGGGVLAPPVIQQPAIAEMSKITGVHFNQEWTNQVVEIEVDTSNTNYDRLLIDGVQTTQVAQNGTYTIQLEKDGKVIDAFEITVSNIDVESPTGYHTNEEFLYTLYLGDNASQINYATIELYRNGVLSNDYTYDIEANIIQIYSPLDVHDLFYVYDYAGNRLEIEIG